MLSLESFVSLPNLYVLMIWPACPNLSSGYIQIVELTVVWSLQLCWQSQNRTERSQCSWWHHWTSIDCQFYSIIHSKQQTSKVIYLKHKQGRSHIQAKQWEFCLDTHVGLQARKEWQGSVTDLWTNNFHKYEKQEASRGQSVQISRNAATKQMRM